MNDTIPSQTEGESVGFSLYGTSVCFLHVVTALLGWAGVLCIVSELCDFPGLVRSGHGEGRSEDAAGTSCVRRGVIFHWALMFSVTAAFICCYECFPLGRFSRSIATADAILAVQGGGTSSDHNGIGCAESRRSCLFRFS